MSGKTIFTNLKKKDLNTWSFQLRNYTISYEVMKATSIKASYLIYLFIRTVKHYGACATFIGNPGPGESTSVDPINNNQIYGLARVISQVLAPTLSGVHHPPGPVINVGVRNPRKKERKIV